MYPRTQQSGNPEPYNPRVHTSFPSLPPPPPPLTYATPLGLPSGLLGPGVPGHGTSRRLQESLSPASPMGASASRLTRRDFLRGPPTSPRMYNPEHPLPATSHSSTSTMPYRDASRTLPPLIFPAQSHQGGLPSIRSAPANILPPSPFRRTLSPEFSFSPPPASSEPEGSSAATFPPPFTLEPQPQWNDPIFTSVPLTGSNTWSHHSSEHNGSVSPTISRVAEPPSREGRYDPVRSMFIPYNSPKTPDHKE